MADLERGRDMLDVRPLVALPDGTVIMGNHRLQAAQALEWRTVPVATVDLDEATAREWALRDNANYAEWDAEPLGRLLAEMGDAAQHVGFAQPDLDRLIAGAQPSPDLAPHPGAGGDGYQEQHGVIVICADEAEQERVYRHLNDELGYENVRVVTT